MSTNSVRPFPGNRNYSGGQLKASQRFEMRKGDQRVHDLFVEFSNFPKRARTWDFQRRLINLAQEIFEGDYSWFIRQDSNALVKDQNYAFILDTIKFIATGRRKFSIYTWPALVTYDIPVDNESVEGRREIYHLLEQLKVPSATNAFIQRWVCQPKGIDDLMYTMHLLFGNVPEKINNPEG